MLPGELRVAAVTRTPGLRQVASRADRELAAAVIDIRLQFEYYPDGFDRPGRPRTAQQQGN